MILLLDTSTGACRLTLVEDETWHESEWQADRQLARDLLGYLRDNLAAHSKTFDDVKGIGVFKGPGSFTGLRIGITVLNTIAETLQLPIVGEYGDDWRSNAMRRLAEAENDKIILPFYGREARVTAPRK